MALGGLALEKAAGLVGGLTVDEIREQIENLPSSPELIDQFFIWSPLVMPEEMRLEQLVILLVGVKLSKTPEGMKVLRDVAVQYLKTVGSTISELASASTTNWLNAIISGKLALRVYKNLGLLSPLDAATLESSYNWIFKLTIMIEGISDTLAGLGTFMKGAAPMAAAMAK